MQILNSVNNEKNKLKDNIMNKDLTMLRSIFTIKRTLYAVLFILISAMGVYYYSTPPGTGAGTGTAGAYVIETNRSMGSADAPIVLEEFSSFTCAHCAYFHRTAYPDLIKKYVETGKVRIVFNSFPLDNIALAASLLALSLPKENFFHFIGHVFFYQDELFKTPKASLVEWAGRADISEEGFYAIISDTDSANAIQRSAAFYQKKYNIKGTPTIILNGVMVDPVDKETLFKAIDKALEKL